MNNTNRAFNRILLFLVGVLFLTLGAAAATIVFWPAGADYWTAATTAGRSWLKDAMAATTLGPHGLSWIVIAVLALIVVVMITLLLSLTRVGGGRSHAVLAFRGQHDSLGRVTVNEDFVSDAMKNALGQRDEILFSSVTASNVRKKPVMHLSVTPRQNTSPRELIGDVDRLVHNLATLTGKDIPSYISVHSGLRAKLAHDQRRLL